MQLPFLYKIKCNIMWIIDCINKNYYDIMLILVDHIFYIHIKMLEWVGINGT